VSELVLQKAFAGGLGPLVARFTPGLHVVLGASTRDLGTLAELLGGLTTARRGRVLLDQRDIGRDPECRRRLAAVLADEELPAARDVLGALALSAELRQTALSPEGVLREAGLSALGSRDPKSLDATERREVALAFALGVPYPALVTLFDPLPLAARTGEDFLLGRCRERAKTSIVVVLSPSLSDAVKFGGKLWWLDRGRLEAAEKTAHPVIQPPVLLVRADSARRLSEELALDANVVSVHFDEARAPREFRITGTDLEALSVALSRAASGAAVSVESVSVELPALDSVVLARAGWVDPSYHGAARTPGGSAAAQAKA
jgi:ABC-type thiamine transport system ATPase subunit